MSAQTCLKTDLQFDDNALRIGRSCVLRKQPDWEAVKTWIGQFAPFPWRQNRISGESELSWRSAKVKRSMPQSRTRQAIAVISKAAMASGLKDLGFRRQSNHLHRRPEDLVHGIHFQASMWGSRDEGEFTLNLLVTSPALYRCWTGHSLPANPATAAFPYPERIGLLMPSRRDHWWDVNPDTNTDALAGDVIGALFEYAIPYSDRFPDARSLLEAFQAGREVFPTLKNHTPIIYAILAKELGNMEEARGQILHAYNMSRGTGFAGTVKIIAERLDLSIEADQ